MNTVSIKLEGHSEYEAGAFVIHFYIDGVPVACLTINNWRGEERFLAVALDWSEHRKLPAAATILNTPQP